MNRARSFAALLLVVFCAGARAADDRLSAHLAPLAAQLDPRAQAALERIDGTDRRWLAARAYLRAGPTLAERWSWSSSQIEAWRDSPQQRALDSDIERVRRAFEKENPGYTLWVNPQVRSFDVQLQRWNDNASVGSAARHLEAQLATAVRAPDFPAPGSARAVARIADLLRAHVPRPVPTLAAPGLSAHGRMSAVDFQVRKDGRTVAGPESAQVASVWIARGWRDRLRAAVKAGGDRFAGPLESPAEPWHYDYRP